MPAKAAKAARSRRLQSELEDLLRDAPQIVEGTRSTRGKRSSPRLLDEVLSRKHVRKAMLEDVSLSDLSSSGDESDSTLGEMEETFTVKTSRKDAKIWSERFGGVDGDESAE